MSRILRHIEQYRKGAAVIDVRDGRGQPLAGVSISAEQESHEFLFGVVLPHLDLFTDAERQRYLERAQEFFNYILYADPNRSTSVLAGAEDLHKRGCLCYVPEHPNGIPLGRLRGELDRLGTEAKYIIEISGRTAGAAGPEALALTERQAGERVAGLYTLCFSHPAVCGIVWKGFCDREPEIEGGGLLSADVAPKYAFHALRKLVGMYWHSRATGQTDAEGRFRFRGFFGDYRLVVGVGKAKPMILPYSLRPAAPEPFVVEMADLG